MPQKFYPKSSLKSLTFFPLNFFSKSLIPQIFIPESSCFPFPFLFPSPWYSASLFPLFSSEFSASASVLLSLFCFSSGFIFQSIIVDSVI
ncbi:hypothetical protein E1A91_A01G133700v1 [Gossypium mustelinum]|uniref:Uncharacterized protein n=1 Tax=Gossypium mustelinum TaxID=34275 RepID=A0A5D3AH53_GOSMU|nr:hypothetical protein E1A91_A01G133700v1 [Gossypium mustelinum]TYJ49439.1 hypothetical protein E1A91_A01G133700v1 [Gossypium mustelinum]TYJ49440.1 hypothetical protein E1A91_A01G133700v1 [Gossypium mustelinum]TYJ49441.1 hypothetical protein E1A91_A01G133700v1 [Gossypium mustelinum]